jgi:arylsulfatase A-like enzyme
LDLFPTLNELCDLPSVPDLEGKTLVPLLENNSQRVRDYAASLYPRSGFMGLAIRTERYRYVGWYKAGKQIGTIGRRYQKKSEHVELYDYQKDPLEKTNLAGLPDMKAVEEQLSLWLNEHVEYTQGRQRQK